MRPTGAWGQRPTSVADRGSGRSPERASQTSDEWIAISVTSDAEWRTLCFLAGFDEGLARLSFAERRETHDALDELIGGWTRGHDHLELMRTLQEAGIAAVAAFDAKELVENEQLAARGFYVPIAHPDVGTFVFPGLPAHLSATPASYRLPAPGLGEHNREVLGGMLGMSDEELAALEAAGVIAAEPPG